MRKLASIKKITNIFPIPNADAIECAEVDFGWKVITKKNEFQINDLAIYFEIDSWIPTQIAPFLSRGTPKFFNGIEGEKLKTVKMRGQISQGLLIPCSQLISENEIEEGRDVTSILNIQKWESPQIQTNNNKPFPNFIQKTDQERCQNLVKEIFNDYYNEPFEISIKLDGSSMTLYKNNGNIGVCSRNLEVDNTSTFWEIAEKQNLVNALDKFEGNIALQGELIGEKIQGNPEKISGKKFILFDIYNIDKQSYYYSEERLRVLKQLQELGAVLEHVPILQDNASLTQFTNLQDILDYAEGKSMNPKVNREGIVFKCLSKPFSFKAISNSYLLKQK